MPALASPHLLINSPSHDPIISPRRRRERQAPEVVEELELGAVGRGPLSSEQIDRAAEHAHLVRGASRRSLVSRGKGCAVPGGAHGVEQVELVVEEVFVAVVVLSSEPASAQAQLMA